MYITQVGMSKVKVIVQGQMENLLPVQNFHIIFFGLALMSTITSPCVPYYDPGLYVQGQGHKLWTHEEFLSGA